MSIRHNPALAETPQKSGSIPQAQAERGSEGEREIGFAPRAKYALSGVLCRLGALTIATIAISAGVVLAQDEPAPNEPAPSTDAAALLQQSREKLAGYRTLKANMTQTVEFGPRRFKAEGLYLQGADNRVRVDIQVKIGENTGRLLQVSEGNVLWTVYEAGSVPRITRRDVRQILAAARAGGPEAQNAQLAELGLGGLPALLRSIERSMDFEPPVSTEIEGRPFYVLQGEWKAEFREQLQAQAQQQPSPSAQPRPLPAHVPELARLYLDAQSLFPYRIRYLKRSVAAGEEPQPLLTLDFRDIVVNASIPPEEFRYVPPGDAQVQDITNLYLQQIPGRGGQAPAQPPQ